VFPETRVGFHAKRPLWLYSSYCLQLHTGKFQENPIGGSHLLSCIERHEGTAINVQMGCTHTLVNLTKSVVIQHLYNITARLVKRARAKENTQKKYAGYLE
jgi:hypothetical protein